MLKLQTLSSLVKVDSLGGFITHGGRIYGFYFAYKPMTAHEITINMEKPRSGKREKVYSTTLNDCYHLKLDGSLTRSPELDSSDRVRFWGPDRLNKDEYFIFGENFNRRSSVYVSDNYEHYYTVRGSSTTDGKGKLEIHYYSRPIRSESWYHRVNIYQTVYYLRAWRIRHDYYQYWSSSGWTMHSSPLTYKLEKPVRVQDKILEAYIPQIVSSSKWYLENCIPPVPFDMKQTVATEAINSATSVDFNMFLFIDRLKGLLDFSDINKYIETLKNTHKGAKELANSYLSVRYGMKLTQEAFSTLMEEMLTFLFDDKNYKTFKSKDEKIANVSQNKIEYYFAYELFVDHMLSNFKGKYNFLRKKGFILNGEILFDIIPYSFVLDWFTSISKWIKTMDSQNSIGKMPVLAFLSSERTKVFLKSEALPAGFYGELQITRFSRSTSHKSLPLRLPPLGSKLKIQNVLDGSALVIQRIKV